MLLDIGDNLFYDTGLSFYEQPEAVIIHCMMTTGDTPANETYETWEDRKRVITQTFDLNEAWFKVTYIYNSPITAPDFLGVADQTNEVYTKNQNE